MKTLFSSFLRTFTALAVTILLTSSAQAADSEQKAPPVITVGEEGFILKSANDDFKLQIRGYVQFDGRFFSSDVPPGTDTFAIRRARPILEGTIFKHFDFRIMPDFGLGVTVLQEAYMDVNFSPALKVRAGKFKPPVGLERLQSAVDLLFVERGLPTDLVPNRDLGVQVFGDVAGGKVSYAAAFLNGVADAGNGNLDNDNHKDGAFRVFLTPFGKESKSDLGVGIAGSYGQADGTPSVTGLPSYASEGLLVFFSYRSDGTVAGTTIADGTRYRITPQGYYYYGPFGVLAEYAFSSQDVRRDLAVATVGNDAWQVEAGYFLTGEKATYKRVKTLSKFNPSEHTWGAFQLKGRYTVLNIDQNAFPIFADPTKSASESKSWGTGMNWYLNNNLKFMLDYSHSTFNGGSLTGDRPNEDLVWLRFQVAF
jgi:phosphate-selective porin OprO and OprP